MYLIVSVIKKFSKIMLKGSQKEWQIVFIICSVIFLIGGVGYCILCDGNLQPWAVSTEKSKKEELEVDQEKESFYLTKF